MAFESVVEKKTYDFRHFGLETVQESATFRSILKRRRLRRALSYSFLDGLLQYVSESESIGITPQTQLKDPSPWVIKLPKQLPPLPAPENRSILPSQPRCWLNGAKIPSRYAYRPQSNAKRLVL
ncbi:MAG: hypothetical protein LQ349_001261 [Xanthoria aureola]|nr:MAG: hypothetical protein LQ349_001261 [Xanthoria aureola]